MRALGRADDPTTGAKEIPGFLQTKYGQTKQSMVTMGSQRKTWALGHQQQQSSGTPAHPWAADTHPYVGRWVVPTTQRPLSVPKDASNSQFLMD